jgi:hypothetical protein
LAHTPRAFLFEVHSRKERLVSTSVFVPSNWPSSIDDPARWPQITVSDDDLVVPGVGLVRILHGYPLAWRLLEHDDCARGLCFATLATDTDCCHGSLGADGPFWIDADRHFSVVDVAIAARMPSGKLEQLVLRGGAMAAVEMQRPFIGDDNGADFQIAITARGNEVAVMHEKLASPSSAVTRLRRLLALPPGWQTHEEHIDPLDLIRTKLVERYPDRLEPHPEGWGAMDPESEGGWW